MAGQLEGALMQPNGKPYKPTLDKDGYLRYGAYTKERYVHRHVWTYFNGPIPEGMTVDHIDGDKLNNHIANLQLLSPEENAIKGNAKHWQVLDPWGFVLDVYNLQTFCKSRGLVHSNLSVRGKTKGYTLLAV